MKICDAADWFNGEFGALITNELHDVPRFHRKQWEDAAILNALSKAGALRSDAVGISFGAAQERPIYAIANSVKHVWATDLYTTDTAWSTARKESIQDPTDFIRAACPFPTHLERISAKSMDMRAIEFPDESFDFAYSSSAVEHIGGWDDFARHLAEVRRVLKPGGVHVMTTDITFGPATEAPGNFKFTPEGLEWWLRTSGMAYEPVVDCRIARHYINTPLPPDIGCYLGAGRRLAPHDVHGINSGLFGMLSMVQCLVGCHPHTSVILVMKKAMPEHKAIRFEGFQETREFLFSTRHTLVTILQESTLFPHPNPWIPDDEKPNQWATTYMWLGGKHRTVRATVVVDQPGSVTIGVNKTHADRYWEPMVEMRESVYPIEREAVFEFPLLCDDHYSFAIYGRAMPGTRLKNINIFIEDYRASGGFDAKTERAAERFVNAPARPELPTTVMPSLLKRTAKAVLMKVPAIHKVFADRDYLRGEIVRLNCSLTDENVTQLTDQSVTYTVPAHGMD